MAKLAIDLHYLPCLELFAAISEAEELLISPLDPYQRQSFLNRTRIRLANKVETLSIPIVGRRPKVSLNQVRLDYSQNWQSRHLRSIQSAYGKAPFFEYFFPDIQEIIESNAECLWDLNLRLMTICLKLLRLPVKVTVLTEGEIPPEVMDIRGLIVPGRPFSDRKFYYPLPYSQLFGLNFEPNLSILDLLFCTGPEALQILRDSSKKH